MLVHLAGGGGAVIAGAKNGVVYSLNPDSGALNWSRRLGQGGSLGGIHWGMASDGTRVYAAISEEVMPIVMAPYPDQPWQDNIRELVARRVRVFETTLPFRLAANIKRYKSPFLLGQSSRFVMLDRGLFLRPLPSDVRADQ